MQYQVTIDIDEVDDHGLRINVGTHQIVSLDNHDEAVKVFNWAIRLVEFQVAAADARLFG